MGSSTLTSARPYAFALFLAWVMGLGFSTAPAVAQGLAVEAVVSARVAFLASLALYLTALVARERATGRLVSERPLAICACTAAVGGGLLTTGILSAGGSSTPLPLLLGGSALLGCAVGALLSLVGRHYGGIDTAASSRLIPVCVIAAALAYALVSLLPAPGVAVVVLVLPLGCTALLLAPGPACAARDATPVEQVPDASRREFKNWRITVQTGAFCLVFGMLWSLCFAHVLAGGADAQRFDFGTGLTAFVFALLVMAGSFARRQFVEKAFWLVVPLLFAALSSLLVNSAALRQMAFQLAFAAYLLMVGQLVLHFACICRIKSYPPTLLYGRAFAALALAELLGVLIGYGLVSLNSDGLALVAVVVLNVLVIALMAAINRVNNSLRRVEAARERSHRDQLIAETRASVLASVPLQALDAQRRADLLSERYGLSARECEVAELLIAGRTSPYIAEKMSIGLSTVNTHVRHIFEKTGVHSRQEFLDLMHAGTAIDGNPSEARL